MDPELWELLAAGEADDEIAAIVRLHDADIVPANTRIVTQFGNIATVRMARQQIVEVRNDESVASLKAAKAIGPEQEVPVAEALREEEYNEMFDRRRPPGLEARGRGCVVGVIDWGLDIANPAFRDENGRTRLLALWDQRGANSETNNRYGYGTIYTSDDINDALAAANPYDALGYSPFTSDSLGTGTHGSHVAGIAVGSRVANLPSGVADLADIVFCHLDSRGSSGLSDLGSSVTILEAVDFILHAAEERPCVINLSVGRTAGQHDGLSLVEQGLDAAVSLAPGRCIVQSAGNYYDHRTHTSGQLLPNGRHDLHFYIDPRDQTLNEIEVWYPGRDEFLVALSSPDGEVRVQTRLNENIPTFLGEEKIGHVYHRKDDPNNHKNHVNVFLYPDAPSGMWTLSLTGENVVDGQYDAWIERDEVGRGSQPRFPVEEAVALSTTGTICNGFETIAVGAFDMRSPILALGSFSSSGPTIDGRPKPNLIAPGIAVLSTRSTPRHAEAGSGRWARKSGTSMAAPHVAGTVACMFEVAGRPLEIQETRRLLLGSADPIAGPGDTAQRVGNGRLNIARAVANTQQYVTQSQEESITADFGEPEQTKQGTLSGQLEETNVGNGLIQAYEHQAPIENIFEDRPPLELDTKEFLIEVARDMVEQNEAVLPSNSAHFENVQALQEAEEVPANNDWHRLEKEPDEGKWHRLEELQAKTKTFADKYFLPQLDKATNPVETILASMPVSYSEAVKTITPRELFNTVVYGGTNAKEIHTLFEVIAYPRDLLTKSLQAGDILLRRGGESRTHIAILTSSELLTLADLAESNVQTESERNGRYAQVIEGGMYPHSFADNFFRRITSARGETIGGQIILRPTKVAKVDSV